MVLCKVIAIIKLCTKEATIFSTFSKNVTLLTWFDQVKK